MFYLFTNFDHDRSEKVQSAYLKDQVIHLLVIFVLKVIYFFFLKKNSIYKSLKNPNKPSYQVDLLESNIDQGLKIKDPTQCNRNVKIIFQFQSRKCQSLILKKDTGRRRKKCQISKTTVFSARLHKKLKVRFRFE